MARGGVRVGGDDGVVPSRRLVDLSMLEAQILCLTYYPVSFEMLWVVRSAIVAGSRFPAWRRPQTGWWRWAAAPRSSGSTCAP